MAGSQAIEKDLNREIQEFHERFPKLSPDNLFVLWFLRAFLIEDDDQAANSLTGGANDKGVDAVYVEPQSKIVAVVQGKYHEAVGKKAEGRSDILAFAGLAGELSGSHEEFAGLVADASPDVQARLTKARRHLMRDGYRLHLFYVSLGRCSANLLKEARSLARSAPCDTTFQFIDGRQVMLLLSDYLDGVAPPVPSLDLEMESGDGVVLKGIFQRYDGTTDIESWVFSMRSKGVGQLFAEAGNRLFARNVRGFLGSTDINRGMEATLTKSPQYFWYFNNGITIICDQAEEVRSHGRNILKVANPQVINGQQTTRMLSKFAAKAPRASVTVRVIRVPRGANNSAHYDALVSKIVAATNWQNAISQSDLMSNDRRQIEIERFMRKLGYWYIRKRQTKGEVKRLAGSPRFFFLKKEEVAQAVAACDLDPGIVRAGKERLFEERLYGQVFPTSDPYYFLTRYWAANYVSYAARGYPERAYAKWVVLHFVWSRLRALVSSRSVASRFTGASERDDVPMYFFVRAASAVYKAALTFYRSKRGKGATALDVSKFFQRMNRHNEFASFWKGPSNRSRRSFNAAWVRFEKELKAME